MMLSQESGPLLNRPIKRRKLGVVAKKQPKRYPITRDFKTIWTDAKQNEAHKKSLLAAYRRTPVPNMRCSKGHTSLPIEQCDRTRCPWHITAPFLHNCMHMAAFNSDGMTLEQIGAILHLTRERVRQIELKAAMAMAKESDQKGIARGYINGLSKTAIKAFLEEYEREAKLAYNLIDVVCAYCQAPGGVDCSHRTEPDPVFPE